MEQLTIDPNVKLVMVIADEPGDRLILQTLLDAHYGVTELPSAGGFTRQVSRTFLCVAPEAEVDGMLALLRGLPAPALVLLLSAERFERVGESAPVA